MPKRKNRVPKSGPVWHRTAEEATLDRMPKYNAHACGTGAHGDAKYNRAKLKRAWQREMNGEGARNRGRLRFAGGIVAGSCTFRLNLWYYSVEMHNEGKAAGVQAIIDLAQSNGGLVTTAQVVNAGIPRARISDMVKAGELERVQRGVYCLTNAWEDVFLAAQLRFPKGIFSDGTALFLHDYTDRTPFSLTMTFPRSYRATKAREAGIEVRTCADDVLDLGLATVKTNYGNEVRAYDLERTLCDMVRGQRVVDVQVVNPAMKRYTRSRERDIQKLLAYASALGVEKKIRNYLEVLL